MSRFLFDTPLSLSRTVSPLRHMYNRRPVSGPLSLFQHRIPPCFPLAEYSSTCERLYRLGKHGSIVEISRFFYNRASRMMEDEPRDSGHVEHVPGVGSLQLLHGFIDHSIRSRLTPQRSLIISHRGNSRWPGLSSRLWSPESSSFHAST